MTAATFTIAVLILATATLATVSHLAERRGRAGEGES